MCRIWGGIYTKGKIWGKFEKKTLNKLCPRPCFVHQVPLKFEFGFHNRIKFSLILKQKLALKQVKGRVKIALFPLKSCENVDLQKMPFWLFNIDSVISVFAYTALNINDEPWVVRISKTCFMYGLNLANGRGCRMRGGRGLRIPVFWLDWFRGMQVCLILLCLSSDRDKEWEKVWKKSLPGVDYKCLCVQREQEVPSVLCFNFQTFQLKPWHNVSSEYTWLE